jgi:hypothetical protein
MIRDLEAYHPRLYLGKNEYSKSGLQNGVNPK